MILYLKIGNFAVHFLQFTMYYQSHQLQSMEFGFSRDLDSSFSRATTPFPQTENGNQHHISCVNDLSVMTQIYLKYNNYLHNERLKRLLNQWNRHENLKVSLKSKLSSLLMLRYGYDE